MSNFLDVQKEAFEKGIILDSCGSAERQYSWGLYTDLCGMSVKDAKDAASACCCGGKGGDDSGETINITATFAMEKVGEEYVLFINTSEAAEEESVATFIFEGEQETVIIPNGATKTNTYLATEDGKQYAEISDINISGGEKYKYAIKNNVKTGFFNLTITVTGTSETNSIKYGTEVMLPSVPEKEGYVFEWKTERGEIISGSTIIMPEYNFNVIGDYKVNSYLATYYIDDEIYSSVTYNYGANIIYPNIPKEGYDLVWIKDYETMPANNIDINGKYIVQTDIACYYGMIYHSGVTSFNDFNILSSVTCEPGVDITTNFIIPANPDYTKVEEEYDEEEFNAWCSAHTRDYYILVPSNANFIFKNGAGSEIKDENIHTGDTVTYKGKQYIIRYYDGTTEIDTEQVFIMLINIKFK